jgi:hypothetical protein
MIVFGGYESNGPHVNSWGTLKAEISPLLASTHMFGTNTKACNSYGCSTTSTTAATTVPEPPKKVELRVASENSLSVKIVPPENNGGANITHYMVHYSHDSAELLTGGRYWFGAANKGTSCDEVCANNNQRNCTDEDFARVTANEVKTLFETLLSPDKCQCMVQSSTIGASNYIVPYFGGNAGTTCTPGPATKGCVYARKTNSVSSKAASTCVATNANVQRLCPCGIRAHQYRLDVTDADENVYNLVVQNAHMISTTLTSYACNSFGCTGDSTMVTYNVEKGTLLTGPMINWGTPLLVTVKLYLGANVWIVGLLAPGSITSALTMVKIKLTGLTSFEWVATKSQPSGYNSNCIEAQLFSEECWNDVTGDGASAGNIYGVSLVTSIRNPEDISTTATTASTTNHPCTPPNSFQNTNGLCELCPLGHVTSSNNELECTPSCVAGSYLFLDDNTCRNMTNATCPPGQAYTSATSSGNGMVGSTKNDAKCTSCKVGRFKRATGPIACVDCDAGTFAEKQRSTECKSCPAGYYQEKSKQTSCVACVIGKANGEEKGNSEVSCKVCGPGEFADTTGLPSCKWCPVGRFLEVEKSSTPALQTSSEDCTLCQVGQYNDAEGQGECFRCPKARKRGAEVCPGCAPGTFVNLIAEKDANDIENLCLACPSGYFTRDRDYKECEECPKGFHAKDLTDTSVQEVLRRYDSCQGCPRGMFGDVTVAVNVTAGCTNCGAGRYSDQEGLNANDKCKKCTVGRWSSSTGVKLLSECINCDAGLYSTTDAATSVGKCISCESGKFSSKVGANAETFCTDCTAGFSQSKVGQAYCLPCMHGKQQRLPGQASCDNCELGSYRDSNNDTCHDCPSGWHTKKTGQASCIECAPGKQQRLSGQASCDNCELGSYRDSNNDTCHDCPSGWHTKKTGQVSCIECAPGKQQRLPGQISCNNCKLGKHRESNNDTCLDCPIGWHAEKMGQAMCVECIPGRSNAQLASATCVACAKNTYAENKRQLLCLECPIGYTALSTASSRCQSCEQGKFGIGCEVCPSGWKRASADVDVSRCLPCNNGESTDGKSGATTCEKCGLGEHRPEKSIECIQCAPGLYQDDKGTSTCKTCAGGEQPNDKKTACENPGYTIASDCDYNTQYLNDSSTNPQEHACAACPLGASCKGNIAWSQVKAKYGWWRLETAGNYTPSCLAKADLTNGQPPCAFAKCLYPHACHGSANPGLFELVIDDGQPHDPALVDRNETCDETRGYKNNCTDEHGKATRCRLCATCLGGMGDIRYKRTGSGTRCKLCPDPFMNKFLLAVGFVVMFCGISFLIISAIRGEEQHGTGKRGSKLSAIKKILLNFMQMVALAASLPLRWTPGIETMFDILITISSAGTTLLIPDCELTHMRTSDAFYLKQIVYTFSIPLLVVGSIVSWCLIFCVCGRRWTMNWKSVKNRMILTITLLIFLCYSMLIKLCLGMFKCVKVGDKRFLVADFQEPCFEDRHWASVLLLSVPQLIILTCLPLLVLLLLRRNRDHLHDPTILMRFGLLYRGYVDGREWWEVTVAIRKFAGVAIGTFGSMIGSPEVQVGLAIFLGFISIVLHLVGQPFGSPSGESKQLHFMELFSLIVIWCTNWGGLMLKVGTEAWMSILLSFFIITLVCSYNVATVCIFGKTLIGDSPLLHRCCCCCWWCGCNKSPVDTDTTHQSTQVVPIAPAEDNTPVDNEDHARNLAFEINEEAAVVQSTADEIDANYESDERHLKENHERRRHKSMINTQLRVAARLKVRKAKTLSKVAMFAQLTPEQLELVLKKMSFTKYVQEDVVCRQGDAAKIFYVIVTGECHVTLHSESDDEEDRCVKTLNTLDYFGESSLIGVDQTRNATVTVSSERLQVLHLNRQMFDALVESGVIGQDAIEHAKAIAEERAREVRDSSTAVLTIDDDYKTP